jgi:hypothetical protein
MRPILSSGPTNVFIDRLFNDKTQVAEVVSLKWFQKLGSGLSKVFIGCLTNKTQVAEVVSIGGGLGN